MGTNVPNRYAPHRRRILLEGEGGEIVPFVVNSAQYLSGGQLLEVKFNLDPTAMTTAGWTVTINGLPVAIAIDSFGDKSGFILTGEPMGELDIVTVEYDEATGATSSGISPLKNYLNTKVQVYGGELKFAAGGSLRSFTGGTVENSTLLPLVAGTGEAVFSNSNLYLPDHEGIYHPIKNNQPPWHGARMEPDPETIGLWIAYDTDSGGTPLPEQPYLYCAPAATNRVKTSMDMLGSLWSDFVAPPTSVTPVNGLTGPNSAYRVDKQSTTSHGGRQHNDPTSPGFPGGSRVCFRCFVKKEATGGNTDSTEISYRTNSNDNWITHLNVITGQVGFRPGFEAESIEANPVTIGGEDWWELISTAVLTGVSAYLYVNSLTCAIASVGSTPDVTNTGAVTYGQWEIHYNKTAEQVRGLAPIVTSGSTVTANASTISYSRSNHSDARGAYYFEFKPMFSNDTIASAFYMINVTNSANMGVIGATTLDRIQRSYDGVNLLELNGTYAGGDVLKFAAIYEAGVNKTLNRDGVYAGDGAYDGAYTGGTVIGIMDSPPAACLVRNIRRYDVDYATGKTIIDGLMV